MQILLLFPYNQEYPSDSILKQEYGESYVRLLLIQFLSSSSGDFAFSASVLLTKSSV